MVGTTLRELRDRIDALATKDGPYRLVCARTGERPVPVEDKWFPDRETAGRAAAATEQYRAALRRYDPRAPYYDVIAFEETERPDTTVHRRCARDTEWSLSEPVLAGRPPDAEHRRRVSFCHDVAAAVFEALSAGGHDAVESAVMDAYFDLAERLPDPDELCLCLLESIAVELETSLDPAVQRGVIADAAERLGPIEGDEDPIDAVFAEIEAVGLVSGFSRPPATAVDGTRLVVDVEGYALSASRDLLPTLPIVLGLRRRQADRPLSVVAASERQDGWRVTFEPGTVDEPRGLACAPIDGGWP